MLFVNYRIKYVLIIICLIEPKNFVTLLGVLELCQLVPVAD